MRLCPPGHAFDIQVVIDIDVVGRAVAAAGAASERERRHHVVVDAADRSDRARRIHDDPSRVDHLAELADDLVVARENDRRVSKPSGMIHVHADLQRLIDGFRPIDRQHREQLLDRERMFPADALDRRNQELGFRLHGKADDAGDVRGFLADCHRLHGAGFGIDDRALQQRRFFLVADVRAQIREFLQDEVVDLVVDHHRLLGGADRSVVEGLRSEDVHHGHIQVGRFFQIHRCIARSDAQCGLSGTVGCPDRARSAGGIDQADIFVVHQIGLSSAGWAIPGR